MAMCSAAEATSSTAFAFAVKGRKLMINSPFIAEAATLVLPVVVFSASLGCSCYVVLTDVIAEMVFEGCNVRPAGIEVQQTIYPPDGSSVRLNVLVKVVIVTSQIRQSADARSSREFSDSMSSEPAAAYKVCVCCLPMPVTRPCLVLAIAQHRPLPLNRKLLICPQ